jgi:hypothetical protein
MKDEIGENIHTVSAAQKFDVLESHLSACELGVRFVPKDIEASGSDVPERRQHENRRSAATVLYARSCAFTARRLGRS